MLQNIADLIDCNDKQGRTYREINNVTNHEIELGKLVEIDTGVRLFVITKTRDCDGAPLYCLGAIKDDKSKMYCGYAEESLTRI